MSENLTSSPNSGNTLVSGIPKRTIRFRATKDDMSDPKWLFGTLHIRKDSFGTICTIEYLTGDFIYEHSSVIPKTIGEFTGRLDMHGKEIYEGDWCRAEFRTKDGIQVIQGHIIMDEFMWCIDCTGCVGDDIFSINRPHNFEVIGNVHDNPELLG